jgi:hypothetical protein
VTTAPDLDPYLLPLPSPASPVVAPHLAASLHTHLNSRYGDPVWQLAPLTGNPSTVKRKIDWDKWPTAYRDEMRLAVWNLINGQLRPTFLHGRGPGMRGRPGMAAIHITATRWRELAAWLSARGIRTLAGCDAGVLHDYGQQLRGSGRTRLTVYKHLVALTRLWALDQLSARPGGIGRPPWEELGTDDYLPAAASSGGGEHATEPLAEQTIGPLLTWAMRLVEDLSGDILAGWAERLRLLEAARGNSATPAGLAALEAYLPTLIASQDPLPATTFQGKPAPAIAYIAGVTGASRAQVQQISGREGLAAAVALNPGPCPLNVPVTGQIAGKPWRTALDFNEVPALMRHLAAASFIVCGYLTGARPAEILALRSGCCPDPAPGPGGQAGPHLIRGLEFKTATNQDGNHCPDGAEREAP